MGVKFFIIQLSDYTTLILLKVTQLQVELCLFLDGY